MVDSGPFDYDAAEQVVRKVFRETPFL